MSTVLIRFAPYLCICFSSIVAILMVLTTMGQVGFICQPTDDVCKTNTGYASLGSIGAILLCVIMTLMISAFT